MQALFSLAYFPPLDYCHVLLQNEHIGLEYQESYAKQTYRNRCYIDSPNGALALSIPVVHGASKIISHIEISYRQNWPAEHLQALDTAYGKAPFYEILRPDIQAILLQNHPNLASLHLAILKQIVHWLQAKITITFTEEWQRKTNGVDYRDTFHPKRKAYWQCAPYRQMFDHKFGFRPNLSVLDLLCNEGPAAYDLLKEL